MCSVVLCRSSASQHLYIFLNADLLKVVYVLVYFISFYSHFLRHSNSDSLPGLGFLPRKQSCEFSFFVDMNAKRKGEEAVLKFSFHLVEVQSW